MVCALLRAFAAGLHAFAYTARANGEDDVLLETLLSQISSSSLSLSVSQC